MGYQSAASTPAARSTGRWDGPLALLMVGGGYIAMAQITLLLDNPVGQGAAFFPAAGLTVAALILMDVRRWPWALTGVFLAELIGNMAHGYEVRACLLWAAANTIEPLIGAGLCRLLVPGRRHLVPVRSTLVFLLSAGIFAPAVGAAIGAFGTTSITDYDHAFVWIRWAVGDALGVLVVAPVLLSWRERASTQPLVEKVALVACLVLAQLVFLQTWHDQWDVSVPYVIVPVLAWAALRHGIRATTWGIALTTQAANLATVHGRGPFNFDDGTPHLLTSLQGYLALVAATTLIMAALAEDLAHRREFEAALSHRALHDTLTGLPNRAFLTEQLAEVEPEGPSAMLVCDIDNFKLVNDSLGHQSGDEFLVLLVERMQECLPEGGVLFRLSGDEFVAMLADVDGDSAECVAESIVRSVARPLRLGPIVELMPSVSVGVADWSPGDDPNTVLRDADAALHEAKAHGRGKVRRFDARMRQRVIDRMAIESDISTAVREGDVYCSFQPELDVATGKVVIVEALARWHHPVLGPIEPERFVPIAESVGKSPELFDLVLRSALKAWTGWASQAPDPPAVAVNVSVVLLADRSLPERILAALDAHGVPVRPCGSRSPNRASPTAAHSKRSTVCTTPVSPWRSTISVPAGRRCPGWPISRGTL